MSSPAVERGPSLPFESLQLHDGTIFPGHVHDVMVAARNQFVTWTYGQIALMPGAHKALDVGDRCYVTTREWIEDAWIEYIEVAQRGVEVYWTTQRRATT